MSVSVLREDTRTGDNTRQKERPSTPSVEALKNNNLPIVVSLLALSCTRRSRGSGWSLSCCVDVWSYTPPDPKPLGAKIESRRACVFDGDKAKKKKKEEEQ